MSADVVQDLCLGGGSFGNSALIDYLCSKDRDHISRFANKLDEYRHAFVVQLVLVLL